MKFFIPQKYRHKYHIFMTIFWITMIIPTFLWWKESIIWVTIMSLYNNIESSFAATEASEKKK